MASKNKYQYLLLFLVVTGLPFINSCEKDQPACRGNCYDMKINGTVVDKSSGLPLSNIPIEVKWFRSAYCIGCTSYRIASGKSGADGSFNFTSAIDTTFFRDYHLTVRIPRDSAYIAHPEGGVHFIDRSIFDFDPTGLQHIKFELYPKTLLKIKLNRAQNDLFDNFTVESHFTDEFGSGYFVFYGHQFAKDTTFTVETSADIYTKIAWKKSIGGQVVLQTDSLVCHKNGGDTFEINF